MFSAYSLALGYLPFALALLLHVVVGGLGLFLYWFTILSAKGSPVHRVYGRRFFVIMLLVALSVGPMLFTRPGAFDPAFVVQFVYLVVCVTGVVTIGWTAIRFKRDLARFRGRHFRAIGFAMTFLGLVVLAAGIATGSLLTASFSLIGLIFGPATLRFAYLKAPPQPRWHISWHLNAVCALFNAVHANILAVTYEGVVAPVSGDGAILVSFYATGVAAIALRVWCARRYDAPVRFAARAPVLATA